MSVRADQVSKQLSERAALADITLHIADGEALALIGPSGSGKKALLWMLAGRDAPDAGTVVVEPCTGARRSAATGLIGDAAPLFEGAPLAAQIALELRSGRLSAARRQIAADRLSALAAALGLTDAAQRPPEELSGGERRRAGLIRSAARALAEDAPTLFVSELSDAFDPARRRVVRSWFRELQQADGRTLVFATQDRDDAMTYADRVAVMAGGRIEQLGTPAEVYEEPATAFVCEYLSRANRLPCDRRHGRIEVGGFTLPNLAPAQPDGPGVALIRDHDIRLASPGGARGWDGVVQKVARSGATTSVDCAALGGRIEVAVAHAPAYVRPGAPVVLEPVAARAYAA